MHGNAAGAVFAGELERLVDDEASSDPLDRPVSSGDDTLEDAADNQGFGDACMPPSNEETQEEEQVSDSDAVGDVGNGESDDGEDGEDGEGEEGNLSDIECEADGTTTTDEANGCAASVDGNGAQDTKELPKQIDDLPEDFESMAGKVGHERIAEQPVTAGITEVIGSVVDTICAMVSTNLDSRAALQEEGRIYTPEVSALADTRTVTSSSSANAMGYENASEGIAHVDEEDEDYHRQGKMPQQQEPLQDMVSGINNSGLALEGVASSDSCVSDSCPAERIDPESAKRREADVATSEDLVDTFAKQAMDAMLVTLERIQVLEEAPSYASSEVRDLCEAIEGRQLCGLDSEEDTKSEASLDVATEAAAPLDSSPVDIGGDSAAPGDKEVRDISPAAKCAGAPTDSSTAPLGTTEELTKQSESSSAACRSSGELKGSSETESLARVYETDRSGKDQVVNVVSIEEDENEHQVSSERDVEVESDQVLVDDADPATGDNLVQVHTTKHGSPRDHSNAPDEREADDAGATDMSKLVNGNDSPSHGVDQTHHLPSVASHPPASTRNHSSATLASEISVLGESSLGEEDGDGSGGQREFSVDSNDLMWEVDEIASFGTDAAAPQSHTFATRSRRSSSSSRRSNRRMDSERILADLNQIEGDKASKASPHASQASRETLTEQTPLIDPSDSQSTPLWPLESEERLSREQNSEDKES